MTSRASGGPGALLILALVAAGCGRTGPIVPPELREPQPATALAAVAREGAIEVSWRNPDRRVDNSRLRDLAVVRLFRGDDAGSGDPRPALRTGTRIAGYREIATIQLGEPSAAVVQNGRVTVVDRDGLEYGRRYTYVVLAGDAQGRVSPPSTRLVFTYVAAPAAPTALRADAGDGEVRLTWQPPSRLISGDPVGGTIAYEVLRSPEAEGPLVAITPAPVTDTTLADRRVQNDRPYYYAVRAVRTDAGGTTRGPASERVAATPIDTTPPSPPMALSAVPSERSVRLAWSASPEPDVAAYVVYRAAGRGELARIGTTRAPVTTYVDRDVEPGIYRYAVTAQDGTPRANESAQSRGVSVTVP